MDWLPVALQQASTAQVGVACFAVAVATVVLYTWMNLPSVRYRSLKLPPGDLSVAKMLKIMSNPLDMFTKMFDFKGPIAKTLFMGPTVLIRDYETVKEVLAGTGEIAEVAWPPATKQLLGELGVSYATGAYHKRLRRLLGPCFTPKAIEAQFPRIQAMAAQYCAEMARTSASATSSADLPRVAATMRLFTFDLISRLVLGFELDDGAMRALSSSFEVFFRGLFDLLAINLPFTTFGKSMAARKLIVKAVDKQLDAWAARAADKQAAAGAPAGIQGVTWGSVMEQLLTTEDEEGGEGSGGRFLSRKALQDIAVTLLFAGHETTSSSLLRVISVITERPDVVARLREEQEAAMKTHGSAITGAALADMPYLDAVVKEAWRLYPLVGVVPRRATQKLNLLGYDVPKGWGLTLGLREIILAAPAWIKYRGSSSSSAATAAQADATAGGPQAKADAYITVLAPGGKGDAKTPSGRHPLDPEEFNPDRWLAPDIDSPIGLLTGPFMVFGGGTRYCLGANLAWAEIKIMLIELIRGYEWSTPLDKLVWRTFPTLEVSEGLPIKISPRAK
mmetsp:Transcript_38966/g.86699  ORF Transcript_38966/g.86699 Transcript_38966/m.86699 type:complete len:562 (-) Transcript_38966:1065-2750(-)|eukprot:CAMPEP_0202893468 /NCGR_PEP_ID=MMETSP1392-20130828/3048_1 /ASSEMBLY_ACC=CAM_ASM_000868 /TAXON_ID=225041 /ORGANISM="Chlamydomonas chlamydogama, Strain SAG 11-48b" /LENGTH=561 /DNA_ID=CAMNT_0049577815 /DNA_START=48 /DNA_END=1733 /DNA_ORIENTATION=+